MKPRLRLLAVALCLAFASPAAAQTMSPALEAKVIERGEAISAATVRTTELLAGTMSDPAIASPTSLPGLVAAIEAKADVIAAARVELRALHDDLLARANLADQGDGLGASDAATLRGMDGNAHKIAALTLRADAILEALQAIPPAARSGDAERVNASIRTFVSGTVVLHEVQAQNMRSKASEMDSGSPQEAQFLAMACFSDGQATLQSAVAGLTARPAAVGELASAEACMRDSVAAGRRSLEALRPWDEFDTLDGEMLDAIDAGAGWLADVKDAVASNQDTGAIAQGFNPPYYQVVARIQDVTMRMNAAVAAHAD
ncbi:hypothetical protein [Brevundimonas sp. Root1279]|uniref:hypothetical protein n=1 Tax=Brevundimonas sp. Root1279 TaxID=1736443 RepID=UPI0006F96B61|nr:hypothetical protein [Brevundimonas sp. Root1279]KQW86601.1 hypothetical protein ASC65_01525 [Brevundimonas sp. Root1279]